MMYFLPRIRDPYTVCGHLNIAISRDIEVFPPGTCAHDDRSLCQKPKIRNTFFQKEPVCHLGEGTDTESPERCLT
jgi:hypothetical protein